MRACLIDQARGTVLVASATGYLGGRVVREAVSRGDTARALARRAADIGPLVDARAEVMFGISSIDPSLEATLPGRIADRGSGVRPRNLERNWQTS